MSLEPNILMRGRAARDCRGRPVRLFSATTYAAGDPSPVDLPREEYEAIRRESSSGDRLGLALIRLALLAYALLRFADGVLKATRAEWWDASLDGLAGIAAVVGVMLIGRYALGFDSARTCAVMLRRGRCPACGYSIASCPPDPDDGCIVCAECGAAWRIT